MDRSPPKPDEDSLRGLAFALTAYLLWGFLPLYMKLLAHIPPAEVVAHRVIWSVPIAGVVLVALRRTRDLKIALQNPDKITTGAREDLPPTTTTPSDPGRLNIPRPKQ